MDPSADPAAGRHEAPPGARDDANAAGVSDDFSRAVALGEKSIALLKSSAELFRLEALLAIQSTPRLVAAWLLTLPAMLLCWLSFSAMVAWACYEWAGVPLVGFVALFALQLVFLLALKWMLRRHSHNMSFPATRASIDAAVQEFKREPEKENQRPAA
ncbi:hypothetical protein [Gilvimarinus algae]|uniref:Phage holin family protein n=1 Tax=Gilvimarinus algae TaxID=3058037 RepID=A0ABT8TIT7_9GAMM|nr:hypothetical protein [Gilvimarinus sp. SDUM040014]MDO3383500.1 hypothetical protein [Gilvimarinus sp. SDUM040014]